MDKEQDKVKVKVKDKGKDTFKFTFKEKGLERKRLSGPKEQEHIKQLDPITTDKAAACAWGQVVNEATSRTKGAKS